MPFFNKILKLANGAKGNSPSSDKPKAKHAKSKDHQHEALPARKDYLMSSSEDSFEIIEIPEHTTAIKRKRSLSPRVVSHDDGTKAKRSLSPQVVSHDEASQQIETTQPKTGEDPGVSLFRKAAGELRSQVLTSPYVLRPDCVRSHGKGKGKAHSRSEVVCRKGRCEGKGEVICRE
ncbi:Hypothetical predicted protein [Lecanosticta acicola]|uniref:Uncharacterized protein n=1 Tax=Lecanosticta acicola TaxID=111012 RepID=A0AAI9EAN9_9PEZI|nr:Hypothetical predicted protein [Lecanosticta acicola]